MIRLKHLNLLFIYLFVFQVKIYAQNCNCDHTITQSGIYRPATEGVGMFYLNVKAGQTICIQQGDYSQIRFFNFQGKADSPIVIKNCGGLVRINNSFATGGNGIVFNNSRFMRLSGNGYAQIRYGILIDSTGLGAAGISIDNKSADIEINNIEITKTGFSGIMAKTDPSCDSSTWLNNFTMYNLHIHNNFIHDLNGEGLYIGNSFLEQGITRTCNGAPLVVYPHLIYGLHVHHNRIIRTWADGLQYACAPDADIHDNYIEDAGLSPFAEFQSNGIQCGSGGGGNIYNNIIKGARGAGIISIGHWGGNKIFNNLIINAKGGIFVDDRAGSLYNNKFDILNNTMINCGDGIVLYNELNENTVANNLLVNPASGRYFFFAQNATAALFNNYTAKSCQELRLKDTLNGNYRPTATSPLVDAGANLLQRGITKDLDGNRRPIGQGFDIGAYELQGEILKEQLLYFNCFDDQIDVKGLGWGLKANTDIKYFEIQRAQNGRDFVTIANGNTQNNNDVTHYVYYDRTPESKIQFYRLLLFDDLNNSSASGVIATRDLGAQIVMIPPSVMQPFLLFKNVNLRQDAIIRIFNTQGQLVYIKKIDANNNSAALISVDLGTLSDNLYICTLAQNNEIIFSNKFLFKFY